MSEDHLKLLKKIIGEKTGLLPHEISAESFIEEDLNIGEMELVEILTELDETLETDISEYKDDIETVEDILDLLAEEVE